MISFGSHRFSRKPVIAVVATASLAIASVTWLTFVEGTLAQGTNAPAARAPAKPAAAAPAGKKPETPAAPAAQAVPAAPAGPAPLAQIAAGAPVPDVTAKLREGGAGTCSGQLNTLAGATMGGVKDFNTVSKWPTTEIDKRLVSVTIGQKFADGGSPPYGATTVIAAPNPQGTCDAVAIQVIPSALPCSSLRARMSGSNRYAGDLVGIPLMQDSNGETMLVPTSSNTCVLIGLRTNYAN